MDTDDILKSQDARILSLEQASRKHEGDIAEVKDKAASAWHEIRETKDDVGNLYDKVEDMDTNVKGMMSKQNDMEKDVKAMKAEQTDIREEVRKTKKLLYAVIAVIVIAGIIAWKKGSDIPGQVVELIAPTIQKLAL